MQRLPISYFDQTPRGDIMSRFTNDTDSLRQVVSQSLPNLLSCGLTVLGVLCMMVYYSLPLMLVVILGIVCMTLATKNIGGKSAKYFVRQQNSLGKAEGFIPRYGNANGGRARRGKRRRSRGRTVGQHCQLCPVQHKGIGKLDQLLL